MKKHVDIKIYGQVQGVFFRDSTKKKADDLGITGFVRNESDGIVYAEAEGDEEKLKEFLAWCQEGSELASVEKVEYKMEDKLKGFTDFVIK